MNPEEQELLKLLYDAIEKSEVHEASRLYYVYTEKGYLNVESAKKILVHAIHSHLEKNSFNSKGTLGFLIEFIKQEKDLCKAVEQDFLNTDFFLSLPVSASDPRKYKTTFHEFLNYREQDHASKIMEERSEDVRQMKEPVLITANMEIDEVVAHVQKAIANFHVADIPDPEELGDEEALLNNLIGQVNRDPLLLMQVIEEFRKKIESGEQLPLESASQTEADMVPVGGAAAGASGGASEMSYERVQEIFIEFYFSRDYNTGIGRLKLTPENCIKKLGLTYDRVLDIQDAAHLRYLKVEAERKAKEAGQEQVGDVFEHRRKYGRR